MSNYGFISINSSVAVLTDSDKMILDTVQQYSLPAICDKLRVAFSVWFAHTC